MSILDTPSLTGTWAVDPLHSTIGFGAGHLGIAIVKGRFERFEGTLDIRRGIGDVSVAGVIDATSVHTGFVMRDEDLRSAEFFDTQNHPQITFVSTGSAATGEQAFEVTGDLTIRGVTRLVTLAVEVRGTAGDQFGNDRAGFRATGEISLRDFRVPYNVRFAGIPMVSDAVQLELDIEATRQS